MKCIFFQPFGNVKRRQFAAIAFYLLLVAICPWNGGAATFHIAGPTSVVEKDGYFNLNVVGDPSAQFPLLAFVQMTGSGSNNVQNLTQSVQAFWFSYVDSIVLQLGNNPSIQPEKEVVIQLSYGDHPDPGYTYPEPFHIRLLDAQSINSPAAELTGQWTINEAAGPYIYAVRLTKPSDQPLQLKWRLTDGTAVAGDDFVGDSGTLTFAPGATNAQFSVPMVNDSKFEEIENFKIELFDASPGLFIATPSTDVLIFDDDLGYRFPDPQATTMENLTNLEVRIERVGSFPFPTTVQARIEPITALPGVDYVDKIYTVEFPPDLAVISATLNVELLNDELEDGTKQFRIVLTNASNDIHFSPQYNSMTVTIGDNEGGYGFVDLNDPFSQLTGEFLEGEDAYAWLQKFGDYTNPSDVTLTFFQLTGNDFAHVPATAGLDFVPTNVTVHFAQGEKRARVPLPIIDDGISEPTELMGVRFSRLIRGGEPIVESQLPIYDNEFNPLPAHPVRPLGLTAWDFAPVSNDKALAIVFSGPDYARTSTIVRVTTEGKLDPTFQPVNYPGTYTFRTGPNGALFLIEHAPNSVRFHRMNLDGTIDPAFSPYETVEQFRYAESSRYAAGPNGELFVAETGDPSYKARIVKLGRDGLPDPSFSPPQIGNQPTALFLAASPDGGVYVASFVSFEVGGLTTYLVKFAANGAIDTSVSSQTYINDLQIFGSTLFADTGNGWVRLLPDGQPDPKFKPFGSDIRLRDAEGRFYGIGYDKDFPIYHVKRFTPDGDLDNTYFPGTVVYKYRYGATFWPTGGKMAGKSLFLRGEFTDVNSTFISSEQQNSAVIDFDPVLPRFELHWDRPDLQEESGPTNFIVLRAGPNSDSTATVHYRLRSGAAIEGKDFLQQEGDLVFAPGMSRSNITLSAINDTEAEEVEDLFIDFFTDSGVPAGSSQITLRSDDFGISVSLVPGATQYVVRMIGPRTATLQYSEDLITWRNGNSLEPNETMSFGFGPPPVMAGAGFFRIVAQ